MSILDKEQMTVKTFMSNLQILLDGSEQIDMK